MGKKLNLTCCIEVQLHAMITIKDTVFIAEFY